MSTRNLPLCTCVKSEAVSAESVKAQMYANNPPTYPISNLQTVSTLRQKDASQPLIEQRWWPSDWHTLGYGWPFYSKQITTPPSLSENVTQVGQPATNSPLPLPAPSLKSGPCNAPVFPSDSTARKAIPIATGLLDYFPLAIAAVAAVSRAGNDQHHPGKQLQWDRTKSSDHADCLMRHFMERGVVDADGHLHSAKAAWRALAILQIELEAGQ